MSIETPISVNSEHEEARIARENTRKALKALRKRLEQFENNVRAAINVELEAFALETGSAITDLSVELRSSYLPGVDYATVCTRVKGEFEL